MLQRFVCLLEYPTELSYAVTIELAVCYVQILNSIIRFKDRQHDQEIVIANIVLAQAKRLDSVCVYESRCEMFNAQAIIEELVKC